MNIQVSSLNGHNWQDYHEKLIQAAREAQRATPPADYATVLAIMKSSQRPSDAKHQLCLTRWNLQVAKQLRAIETETGAYPLATETHRAAMDAPKTASRKVNDTTADTPNPNADRAEPGTPANRSHPPATEIHHAATTPAMEHHRAATTVKAPPVEMTTTRARRTPSGMRLRREDRRKAAGDVKDAEEGASDDEDTASVARSQPPRNAAKVTTDQGAPATINARAQSAAQDHPTAG